ncbi:423_t:CDS:2 [Funneliformis caledonium]|uniref:423_t:CDS:1 n=1 Tax=Funneliformis caledonium TaxID=1117310 RepID=A0A9N8VCI5_9GLOM|nr:423_t:CDS:2 [Funneliformis caledonium]
MAQGPLAKKFKVNNNNRKLTKTKSIINKSNGNNHRVKPKKGAKSIAPKKQSLIKQQSIQKKLTAAINKNIEQVIASRAESVGGGQKFNIVKLINGNDNKEGKNKSKK